MKEEISISNFVDDVRAHFALPKRITLFDTTLRDGEQTPGVSLTADEKLDIAHALDALGVNVIEAGYAVVSPGEHEAVKKIAAAGLKAETCSLARTKKEDIDAAISADVKRVHAFIGTSELHLKYKLKMSEAQALEKAVESIEYVKKHGVKCEFSAEDATRTRLPYLKRIYAAAVDAGADIINVPDTVGVMVPESTKYLITELRKSVKVPLSIHCHNDFGLAAANTLAALEAGAEQAHVTVNGIGERAGNASLEQVAVALYAFHGKKTVELARITETSELVERYTGVSMSQNAPIIGANAFSHESGIHVHGVLQKYLTYEPFTPELVGKRREIVIGRGSGAHAVSAVLKNYGIRASDEQVAEITKRFKELADKGGKIGEKEMLAIAEAVAGGGEKMLELKEFLVTTGSAAVPTASVRLRIGGEEKTAAASGVGPIDAVGKAIRGAIELPALKLVKFKIDSVGSGTDAVAEVFIKLQDKDGRLYFARGVSDDIVKASVEALAEGYNKALLSAYSKDY